jgi:sialate O-acetylesterase
MLKLEAEMTIDWRTVLAAAALMAAQLQVASAASPAGAATPPALDSMFQDHAVLQRDKPIPIWGTAHPGDQITVSINASTVRTRAEASGHWRVSLPAMPAGGPYSLSVRTPSGAGQSISDLLVGDVWLCSGQSNMELPVTRSLSAAREISASANDSIRVLTVAHASSAVPLEEFSAPVSWHAAGPATIGDFSAVCYYFARELQKSVPVPMGLIHSSFGGSRIEPWLSEAGLRAAGGYDERLDLLRLYAHDPDAGNLGFAEMWKTWWRARAPAGSAPWKAVVDDPRDWHEAPERMRDWKTWGIPEFANHDGMAWFRRSIVLSAEQAAQAASLSLGAIDEVDETWVNERAIANSFGWGTERTYSVPAGVLHAGENSIVVNVLSTWDAAGMYGPPDHMALRFADGSSVALGGQWRYQFVPESMGYPPRAPWESIGGLSTLHNAMIAPIEPYGLRGVLWYQGESNADAPGPYQALLSALMIDWRKKFGAELPFLIVELPNFGAPPLAPAASGWASLREAQRRAVAGDAHAALVVAIDVGDRRELHPPNKQEVGRRLARAARRLVYGAPMSASGPVPLTARRDNAHIAVSFNEVDGALIAYSATRPTGFELCGDDQVSCRFVDSSIQGNRVLLDPADMPMPTRVRFCWGDAPICNLYDRSGLPAGPFEIPIQK